MKKNIFIFLFTFLLINKISAQSSELVYIRIQEPLNTTGRAFEASMVIVKPDNSTETVALKKLGPGGSSLDENAVFIKNEIAKWLNKGFKVLTINNSGGDYVSRTEIFLKKE